MKGLAQLVALIVAVVVVPTALLPNPQGYLTYSSAIALVSVGLLIWPVPRLWFGTRPFATALLLFAAMPGLIVSSTELVQEREAYLVALRDEDPMAYLDEIERTDPDRWYRELRELDPDRFDVERQRRAEERRRERQEAAARAAASRAHQCSSAYSSQAYIYSQAFVEQRLRSPTSARFPNIRRDGVSATAIGDCSFHIRAYVDAQNAFGAEIRTPFAVVLRRIPERESWELISIQVGG